ncbi:Structural maintenance of chromosome protein 4 [Trachipleistophora hominis]|uniref:Structural maintenance of chromosome protein 4 n=1 Tax=Trachipleistophora hominis TaxID=72359 RepID=L7K0F5_TRAHO|nr:Structural maintenance of chromosome protein 4 [Trachipleistophora hominis]
MQQKNIQQDRNLKMTDITLYNFKSYEGHHRISNISNFTTVVGSNGSGKSNIIDAVLFLFGYSAKKMRHKVNSGLINKGKDSCYVEIKFTASNDQFSVKRELIKGRSLYYINDKEVNVAEVRDKMKYYNVDLEHNRFLILQGEIEAIAMMKPKDEKNVGILEYLEDIIGTNVYHDEIQVLEQQLSALKEKEDVMKSSFKFQEKEFNFVRAKNESNEQLLNERAEWLKEKIRLNYLEEIKEARVRDKLMKENKSLENELSKIKNNDDVEQIKMLEGELVKHKSALSRKEREFLSCKQEVNRINREILRRESDYEMLVRTEKMAVQEYENTIREQKMNQIEVEAIKTEKDENMREIDVFEKKLRAKEDELVRLRQNCKHGDKIRALKKLMDRYEKDILNLNEKKSRIRLNQTQQDEVVLRNKILECEKNLNILKGLDRNICTDMRVLKNNIQATEQELESKKEQLREAKQQNTTRKTESELIGRLKGVEGFIGRLGDLGRVNSKYDIAITAASKGKLNNIVVKSVESAENCIKIINTNGLKRTSFLVMDRLVDEPLKKDKDFVYCVDLIDCKEKYKKAFSFVLKDTILCNDLDEATSVAFDRKIRRRTVSLQGDLIEKSGIMSRMKVTGSMNTQVDTEKLEKKLARIEAAKSNMENLLKEKEEQIRAVKSILDGRKEANECINDLEQKMGRMIDSYCKLTNKSRTDDLNALFRDDNEEMRALDEKVNELKNEIKGVRKEIEDLEGNEIKGRTCDKQLLTDQINLFIKRNQDLDEKMNRILLLDTQSKLKNVDNTLKDARRKMKEIESMDEIKKECNSKTKLCMELETVYENEQDEIRRLCEQINDLKNVTEELMQKELEIRNRIEKNLEKMKKKSMKNDHMDELKVFKRLGYRFDDIMGSENDDNISKKVVDYKTIDNTELDNLIGETQFKIQKLDKNEKIDFELVHEYKNKKIEYENVKNEYNRFMNTFDTIVKQFSDLKNKRHEEFMNGFAIINKHLKEIYQTITFGGNAELELVDYTDPFSEGVVLSVMPPKKTWNKVSSLSGGEKTLASLALVFALHTYSPSPFYVMDEIDAALDFRNVSLVANLIKEQKGQFLVISLRNDMFELADKLVGVYKNEGKSNIIVLDADAIHA